MYILVERSFLYTFNQFNFTRIFYGFAKIYRIQSALSSAGISYQTKNIMCCSFLAFASQPTELRRYFSQNK